MLPGVLALVTSISLTAGAQNGASGLREFVGGENQESLGERPPKSRLGKVDLRGPTVPGRKGEVSALGESPVDPRAAEKIQRRAGPSGSGGGNFFEAQYTRALKLIKQSVSSALASQPQPILKKLHEAVSGASLQFAHGEDPAGPREAPRNPTLTIAISSAGNSEPDLLTCLNELMARLKVELDDPELSRALEEAVRKELRVPDFLGFPATSEWVAQARPDDQLPGCRDQLRLQADPLTGQLILEVHSTGSCFLPSSPGFKRVSVLVNKYHSPQFSLGCEQVGNRLVCQPPDEAMHFDTMGCLLNRRAPLTETPPIVVDQLGTEQMRVRFHWCSDFDGTQERYELNRTFILRPTKLEPRAVPVSDLQKRDIRQNLESARRALNWLFTQRLVSTGRSPIGSEQSLLAPYWERLQFELANSPIDIDFETAVPFVHFGEQTFIETDLRSGGTIRLRIAPMVETLEEFSPLQFAHWLGHELAHHVLAIESPALSAGEMETTAQTLAQAIETLLLDLVPVGDLLKISLGNYFAPKAGCRDQVLIERVDPWKGLVHLKSRSSGLHCRIYGRYMDVVSPHDRYQFDETDMELECRTVDEGTFCRDRNPEAQFSVCRGFVREEGELLRRELRSILEVGERQNLRAIFRWCIRDTKSQTSVASVDRPLSKRDRRLPVSPQEIDNSRHLENSFGGGLWHQFK